MVDRVAEYEGATTAKTGPLGVPSSFSADDLKKYAGSVEELILKYPGPALATAFMVGVLVAWLIKRK